MKSIIFVIYLCEVLLLSTNVFASDPNTAMLDGAQWLIDRQGDMDGWELYNDYSAYAVRAFIAAGRTDSPKYQLVLNRLLSLKADDGTYPDVAGMPIWALAEAGYTKDEPELQGAVNYLISHHDPIECWDNLTYRNSVNIIALIKAGVSKNHPVITTTVDWLKSNQNPDGYWGMLPGGESTLNGHIAGFPITALCVADSSTSTYVEDAIDWLYAQMAPSSAIEEHLAYTLEALDYAGSTSKADVIKNYILVRQLANGGWSRQSGWPASNRTTAYPVISLANYGVSGDSINNGISWIEDHIDSAGVFICNYQKLSCTIAMPALYAANLGNQEVQDAVNGFINNQAPNGSWSWWSYYQLGTSDSGEIKTSADIINYIYDCELNDSYPVNIQNAVSYIYNGRNSDGGWGYYIPSHEFSPSQLYITCPVTEALLRYGYTSSNSVVSGGLSWILSHMEGVSWGNCADTARAIKVLHRAGGYDGIKQTAIDWLYANQNPDGGWGSRLNESSTVTDTSEVLIALGLVGHSNNDMLRAAQWLVNAQNADGGWASRPRVNASGTINTSYAVWALAQDYSGAGDLGVTVIADSNSYYNGETATLTVITDENDCELEASISDPEGWNKRIYFIQDDPNNFHIDLTIDQYRLGTYTVLVQASTTGGNEGFGIVNFGVQYDYVIPGDVSKDGKVDFIDFAIMAGNWLKEDN